MRRKRKTYGNSTWLQSLAEQKMRRRRRDARSGGASRMESETPSGEEVHTSSAHTVPAAGRSVEGGGSKMERSGEAVGNAHIGDGTSQGLRNEQNAEQNLLPTSCTSSEQNECGTELQAIEDAQDDYDSSPQAGPAEVMQGDFVQFAGEDVGDGEESDRSPEREENDQHESTPDLNRTTERNNRTMSSWNELSREELIAIRNDIRPWKDSLCLLGLVMVTGSVRFTVDQFDVVRSLPLCIPDSRGLPTYKTLRRLFSSLLRKGMANSIRIKLPVKKKNTRIETAQSSPRNTEDQVDLTMKDVLVVLPTSWARIDIATESTFLYLFGDDRGKGLHERTIEGAPIIVNREGVCRTSEVFYVTHGSTTRAAGRGAVLKVYVDNAPVQLEHSYVIGEEGMQQYCLTGEIAAVWCVSGTDIASESATRALKILSLTTAEKSIITALSISTGTSSVRNILGVRPGDICGLLRPRSRCGHSRTAAVIVARVWKEETSPESSILFWCVLRDTENGCTPSIRRKHVVSKIRMLSNPNDPPAQGGPIRHVNEPSTESEQEGNLRLTGKLMDGTDYVVYRILLYCDDFQPRSMLYPAGSAGGCYMMPIGLPPEARRTTSAVRVVSLTPPGVSTDAVLHYIVEDIVKSTVEGVECVTPNGRRVKCFTDVVGFIADYKGSADTSDLLGHTSRAPCTVCTFRSLHRTTARTSCYGYTVQEHSMNSAYLRCGERQQALRSALISDGDARKLGMKEAFRVDDQSAPLNYLQRKLDEHRDSIALTEEGKPVVSGMFDAYRCNLVAPDHLLTGLLIDSINSLFSVLNKESIERVDCYVTCALDNNGLLKQQRIYNSRTKALNSMSLSAVFCVSSTLAVIVETALSTSNMSSLQISAMNLMKDLHRLVAFTYWWPREDLDGIDAVELVCGKRQYSYHSELQEMSKAYVRDVNNICTNHPGLKQYLDKPNLHRLLELYHLFIPMFGHAREFAELVFEHAHQPLKRCIARSNFKSAHISAVEHSIANDWQGRIASLNASLGRESQKDNISVKRSLRRLFIGEHAEWLSDEHHIDVCRVLDQAIQSQLGDTVLKQFSRQHLITHFASPSFSKWICRTEFDIHSFDAFLAPEEEKESLISFAAEQVGKRYPSFRRDTIVPSSCTLFYEAKRMKMYYNEGSISSPLGAHETIRSGCALAIRITDQQRDDAFIHQIKPGQSNLRLFAVLLIAQCEGRDPWAVTVRCSVESGNNMRIRQPIRRSNLQFVRMTDSVRRVGIHHNCAGSAGCTVDVDARKVNHGGTLLSGSTFLFQTRMDGYPPRMG